MGGQGKGGARASFLPPARSRRPVEGEGGPTITEKIKARKAAGGAEAWDDWKARIKQQQQSQHELENQDVMMSAQHRELLDRERDARLRRDPAEQSERKRKERSSSSSKDGSGSDDSDSSSREKKRRKKHRHHKHKSGDKDKKKSKHKHKRRHRHRHRDSGGSGDERKKPTAAASGPVKLSAFLAEADSDAL